jgi:hypothetical protein
MNADEEKRKDRKKITKKKTSKVLQADGNNE